MKKQLIMLILLIGISLNLNAGAADEYKKACDSGNTDGCNNLGVLYVKGQEVNQSYLKAKVFFEKSCNAGNTEGCEKYAITKSLIEHQIKSVSLLKNKPLPSRSSSRKVMQPNIKSSITSSKLYRDYRFGMLKVDIQKNSNVYDCAEEFEKGALCIDEEKFVGEDVSIGFRFINDKLVAVVLFSEFTVENHLQFVGALNSRFQLVTIESDNEKLDFLVQIKKYKESKFLKSIADFEERALAKENIKYTFFEKESFEKMVKTSDNAVAMLMNADTNIRVVEYIIFKVDDKTVINLIQFTTPQEIHRILREKSKQKYEEF